MSTDVDLIVELHRWALSLGASELTRQFRASALRLRATTSGSAVFTCLVRALLNGSYDEPLEGLILLAQKSDFTPSDELLGEVAPFVDHPDYAVAVLAERLMRRWGLEARTSPADLPGFYRLALDRDDARNFERPQLADARSDAMRVEDPLGWTYAMPEMIRPLARNGISTGQIRLRCAQFIARWGGLEAFGQEAIKRTEADLGRVQMRLSYGKPHMVVAIRALRYVAGELRRAGIVGPHEEPPLLHLLDILPVGIPHIVPSERPQWIPRSVFGEGLARDEEEWLDAISSDMAPLAPAEDETLVASISRYERHNSRQKMEVETIRLPLRPNFEGVSPDHWFAIPRAVWMDGIVPIDSEPSPVFVRRLSVKHGVAVPQHFFVVCPHWMQRLRWRQSPDNWMVLIDPFGSVVARSHWWRDGGPVDVREDASWGEGMFVLLTPEGTRQVEAMTGPLRTIAASHRTMRDPAMDEPSHQRVAISE